MAGVCYHKPTWCLKGTNLKHFLFWGVGGSFLVYLNYVYLGLYTWVAATLLLHKQQWPDCLISSISCDTRMGQRQRNTLLKSENDERGIDAACAQLSAYLKIARVPMQPQLDFGHIWIELPENGTSPPQQRRQTRELEQML